MARVKRAINGKKHRSAVLESAQGYYGNRSRSFRSANEAVMHSLQYAYRDRRARKGDFRRLWIQRINAGARANGLSYSRLIAGLRHAEITVDRKVLADLAVTDPDAFAQLVAAAKAALADATVGPRWSAGGRTTALLTTALAFRHQRVQRLRRLLARRSVRRSEGAFVVEGVKLLVSALDAGAEIEAVFVDAPRPKRHRFTGFVADALARGPFRRLLASASSSLAPGVLERVADTVTPQPLLAVVRMPTATLDDLAGRHLRGGVRRGARPRQRRCGHPGGPRLGCPGRGVLRGHGRPLQPQDGAGFGGFCSASARRGGRGRRRTSSTPSDGHGSALRLAAVAHGGTPYTDVDLISPLALVLGNEASGLPSELEEHLDARVTIPMLGGAESLNVSTAAAVLCFEVARRRSNLHAMEEAR